MNFKPCLEAHVEPMELVPKPVDSIRIDGPKLTLMFG